ncbi:MAG: hypothetical protein QOH68_1630, partial [Nocardioidaceae bacterium]|nr:hypothetical protein [Nocardioidaceae bacterium]
MQVRKLSSTDAFVVIDLEGVDRSVGIVRLAPKILGDGVELLARATTYAYATFGIRAGGASAGINSKPDTHDAAVTAFCEEVAADVASGKLHLSPGTGLDAEELAPLGCEPLDLGLGARGAAVAAAAFTGGGKAVVFGGGDWVDRVGPWWTEVGGTDIIDGGIDADVDVLFLAGKSGVVDHDAAAKVRARAVVPLTPVPITAKAFAVLERAGVTFVPDAVSCAAPQLAVVELDSDPIERVRAA